MSFNRLMDISPDWVRLNRRLWAGLFLGQLAFTMAVVLLEAADLAPARVRLTPQLVSLDLLLLAMGVALLVLHRRHPALSGDPTHDRPQYGRNILFPMGMLAAASVFGMVIVLVTDCLWPGTLVPMAALATQLAAWPADRVCEE
jgi:hypothetical protein